MRGEEKKDKRIAIFHAVSELLSQGEDINTLKVEAITRKAEIGKGTAYEYFSTKEELIVKALLYFSKCTTNRLLAQMDRLETFEEKLYFFFDEMVENDKERSCAVKCINAVLQNQKLKEKMLQLVCGKNDAEENPMRIVHYLLKEGKKQNIVSDTLPDSYLEIMFVSKAVSFLVYLEQKEKIEDCSQEEMKKFLYEGIIKELRE